MSRVSNTSAEEKPFFTVKLVIFLVLAAAVSAGITYYVRYVAQPAKPSPHANNPNVIPLRPEPIETWRDKSKLTQEQNYVAQQIFPHISKNQKPIKDCYFGYRGTEKLPFQTGARVTVQFTVHADGHVSNAGIFRSEMKVKAIHDCILKAMSDWKFPRHSLPKPLVMQYPFFFR